MLFGNLYFMSASMIPAFSIGAIYALATILPFILMNRSACLRSPSAGDDVPVDVVPRRQSDDAPGHAPHPFAPADTGRAGCPAGVALDDAAALLPSGRSGVLSIMGPVAIYCVGVAFFLPTLSTASLGPFPTMAGAAASLGGFLQMVTGLLGGLIAGLMGDPLLAYR
jgi:MFS transporter, DHA1 family, multidrug resistance protein